MQVAAHAHLRARRWPNPLSQKRVADLAVARGKKQRAHSSQGEAAPSLLVMQDIRGVLLAATTLSALRFFSNSTQTTLASATLAPMEDVAAAACAALCSFSQVFTSSAHAFALYVI